MKVDLNCDMGESFGSYVMGQDSEMMQLITSANIACGYHAGDPQVMRNTVDLAKKYGVGIGAHPGFPDLMGFGRRVMHCTPSEIKNFVIYQLGALREFASIAGVTIQHCKPHGALFMMAMEDETIAQAMLEAIAEMGKDIIVFALNRSAVAEVGERMGIPIAKEGYADREHTASGSIVLTRTGPAIEDYTKQADRVVRMVKAGKVQAHSGEEIDLKVQTVCIHGDTPGAVNLAKAIRDSFNAAGIELTSIRNIL
ncbi:LamB/YcsF family protein [Desmospora activa]|uniref:5-oxoprolinase subunit A n=1 Tax=Desmospora activa DSM 45169 TaxID=1121389 RepID=A0A2T4Z6L6_9BACL|nr:5-oxoprolinase subunit PxpA [Desmospora activa]PTM57529.1 UPF0271 protein [Desmospora activa DSM 45169]